MAWWSLVNVASMMQNNATNPIYGAAQRSFSAAPRESGDQQRPRKRGRTEPRAFRVAGNVGVHSSTIRTRIHVERVRGHILEMTRASGRAPRFFLQLAA